MLGGAFARSACRLSGSLLGGRASRRGVGRGWQELQRDPHPSERGGEAVATAEGLLECALTSRSK